MNFIILLLSSVVTINGINGSPINQRHLKEGPDADSLDPIGSGLLRPVFLGKSTGISGKKLRPSLASRSSNHREQPLEIVDSVGSVDSVDSIGESVDSVDPEVPPEETFEASEHFGLPLKGRRQLIRNERIFHPDSDGLKGRFSQVVVDDPLPEMIAGGDVGANPFAQRPSLTSIIGQLLMDSIGL